MKILIGAALKLGQNLVESHWKGPYRNELLYNNKAHWYSAAQQEL